MIDNHISPVCLICPPSAFLVDDRVFINLGILKVATVLENTGIEVEMLDLSGVINYENAINDHLNFSNAQVFGLTATTPQMPAAMKICKSIRKLKPNAKIILGGPHVTFVNASYKRHTINGSHNRAKKLLNSLLIIFDTLVAGDGEKAIFDALKDDAPKIIDADSTKSNLFLTKVALADTPFPARHLVDVDSYHYWIDGRRALSLITQLGCPFNCGFCGGRHSPSFRIARIRNIRSVIDEIMHLHKTYEVNGFMLYDDELNVNPQMVELMYAISEVQLSIGENFHLRGFVKAQLFTDEQAKAMYHAGFRWILAGFESGSPTILKNINKKSSVEDNTRCIEIAKRNGLKVKALMSIGHPGESEETIIQTYNWLIEVQPDDFDVTIITPYPGTPYYDLAYPHSNDKGVWIYTCNGYKLYSYEVNYCEVADYYKGDPDNGYKSYVYTDYISGEALVSMRDFIERDLRLKLDIPFSSSAPGINYEHSMGQIGAPLSSNIFRSTYNFSSSLYPNDKLINTDQIRI